MEVYQALSLMFMFGKFIIALLNYSKRNRPPCRKDSVYLLTAIPKAAALKSGYSSDTIPKNHYKYFAVIDSLQSLK
ncbi:putative holin-like toxin [Paenibacillus monticola]|uniref:putative holin-like toxin n=1 Tax=Paenibacillus monticola TaxID=2666075 RepID=UPI00226D389B|nr:putative holin-like toxin [Paenibacillus monticola]